MARHYNGRFRSRKSVQPPSLSPRPRMSLEEQDDWVSNHFLDKYTSYLADPGNDDKREEGREAHQLVQEHRAEEEASRRFPSEDKDLRQLYGSKAESSERGEDFYKPKESASLPKPTLRQARSQTRRDIQNAERAIDREAAYDRSREGYEEGNNESRQQRTERYRILDQARGGINRSHDMSNVYDHLDTLPKKEDTIYPPGYQGDGTQKGIKARVTPRGTVTGHLTDGMGRERCFQEGRVVPCPNSTYTPRVDERQRPSTNHKGIKSDRPHKGKGPRALEGERFQAQVQQTFPTSERDRRRGQRNEQAVNDEIRTQWDESHLADIEGEDYYDEGDFKRMRRKASSANNALTGGSLIPPSVQGRFVQTNRNRIAITPPTVAKRKAFGPPHVDTDTQKRDYNTPGGGIQIHVPNNYRDYGDEPEGEPVENFMTPAERHQYLNTYARRNTRLRSEEIQGSEGKAIPSDPRDPSQSLPPVEDFDQEPLPPEDPGEVRRAQSRPNDVQAPSVPPRKQGERKPIHIPPTQADELVQEEQRPNTAPPVTEVNPPPSPSGEQLPEGIPMSPSEAAGVDVDNLPVADPVSNQPQDSNLPVNNPSTGPGNPTVHVDEIARLMSQGELDGYAAEDVLSDLNGLNVAELREVYDRLVNEDFDAMHPGQTNEFIHIIDGIEKLIDFKTPKLDADVQALNNPVELQNVVKSTPVKQSLGQANVVDMQRTGNSGANTSYIYSLEDGSKGVFKPQYGESPGLRLNVPGQYYVREVASSEVAEILGMDDLLPSTVFRKEHDKIGSIQNFVSGQVANNLGVDDRYDGEDDLARAAAYDYLVGNSDRHDGNWMITDNGRLALIDNGLAFPTRNDGEDFGNADLLFKASIDNLPVPPIVQEWYNKWDQIETILRVRGVEEESIYAMADRLHSLVNIPSFKGLVRTGAWTDLPKWFV